MSLKDMIKDVSLTDVLMGETEAWNCNSMDRAVGRERRSQEVPDWL